MKESMEVAIRDIEMSNNTKTSSKGKHGKIRIEQKMIRSKKRFSH